MVTFIVIGAIGLILVATSMLLGEFIEFGDGVFSGTSLGVAAICFGAVGAIVTANNLPVAVAWAGSLAVAVVVTFLVQRLIKHLRDTEDGVPGSLVGAQGIATSDIDPGRGEVSLDVAQELERRLAFSEEHISEGARVVVVEHSGSRVQVRQFFPND